MTATTRITEISLVEVADHLARGDVTSEGLAQSFFAHINAYDSKIKSVLALNPHALDESRAADDRRKRNTPLSALDGVPILIKDNIDTAGLPTTAGSLALTENLPSADAAVVKRLRAAGMTVLGKTNLSEWSNFRSSKSTGGWSAVGGLTRNPYDLNRSACGSSSGSAAAVAAHFAPAAIGTETDGSVVWPAAMCGVVGIKPTLGLVPQHGVIPISHEQDTPGPITRNVADAAMLLNVMAEGKAFFETALDATLLKGSRLGALRFLPDFTDETLAAFERSLDVLRHQGATIVDINSFDMTPIAENLLPALLTEFKVGINAYLATTHRNVKTRTLADLIAFNRDEPRELEWFGQEYFEMAEKTDGLQSPAYRAARAVLRNTAGPQGIDRLLSENNVVALLAPTNDPAKPIVLGKGDTLGGSASTLPSVAGYPHLTVPAGYVSGLPVGLSFIGTAGTEWTLLSLGLAFERSSGARRTPNFF